MRTDKYLYVFFLYLHLFIFTCSEKNESDFVPTKEWQVIKKGMTLPTGLHIRYNMETGTLEAKLVEEEKKNDKDPSVKTNLYNSKSLILHPDEVIKSEEDDSPKKKDLTDLEFTMKEIENVLKKKKDDRTGFVSSDIEISDIENYLHKESFKRKLFKKKDSEVVVKTDTLLFNLFFNKFKKYRESMRMSVLRDKDIEIILELLNNLEYVIHHIDSGRLFTKLGGLTELILPCLNSTYNNIKSEALRLLGAVSQSNPEVQNKALEIGLARKLLRLLSISSNSSVRNRCVYALGALIRNFPEGQKNFFEHGGIALFVDILYKEDLELQYRIMRLVNDLIVERQNIGQAAKVNENNSKENNTIIADQYLATGFKNRLLMHGYCQSLMDLMENTFKRELSDPTKIDNYELLGLVTESMIRISTVCTKEFHKKQDVLLRYLNAIVDFYENIGKSLDSNEISLINDQIMLAEKLIVIIEVPLHDEL